jgi:hypothetical protein
VLNLRDRARARLPDHRAIHWRSKCTETSGQRDHRCRQNRQQNLSHLLPPLVTLLLAPTLFRGHIKLGTSAIAGSTLRILAFNVRFEAVVGFDHQCWTSSSGGKWPVDTEGASIAASPAICVRMVAPTDASHGLRYACSSQRSVAASRINCTDVSLHESQLCK